MGRMKEQTMIHNQIELAKEVGSRSNDPKIHRQDILTSVRKHTDGQVYLFLKEAYVEVRSTHTPVKDRIAYPFRNDDFWKTVEFVQEEGMEYDWEDEDDEDEEDILDKFGISNKRPHEYYD